jgi:hypothetical protein
MAFFCESLSGEKGGPTGEVGVKGPDALAGLEVSDGLRGKGIDDGLLCSRGGGVADGAGDGDGGMFEEDRERREGEGGELGKEVVGSEYGIGGAEGGSRMGKGGDLIR